MRFFTTLAEFVNHLVIDHALRLDKMRKGLGRIRRLTCQGYKLKVEVPGLQTLGLKIAGGNLPRDSWGRYSL